IAELSERSPEFARIWDEYRVKEKENGRKLLAHPEVGLLDVGFETLALPGQPGLLIVVYTVAPDSPEAAKLARLEGTGTAGGVASPVELVR
ncbi:MAG: transcriptional regulator, partial [Streptomycetaceae bacterium]|nr:transcriptional regulator [Streptomycetaceae bacterium]